MTTNQSLNLIKEGKPWRSIITHFSPRYDRIGETMPEHSKLKALIAFDFMRVSWSQLDWAWQYTDLYASLIKNDYTP